MKTAKEIFETVKKHLMAQGMPSMDENETCMYRGDNGTKCAVGCLITDEAYTPSIEEISVDRVRISPAGTWEPGEAREHHGDNYDMLARALTKSGIPATQEVYRTLKALQVLHDTVDAKGWAAEFDKAELVLFGDDNHSPPIITSN